MQYQLLRQKCEFTTVYFVFMFYSQATANSLANHSMLKDNFEMFVMTLLVTDLNGGSKVLFKLGTLFSELIINKTLSIKTVNKG